MESSSSSDRRFNPKALIALAFEVKDFQENNLLHRFVLDNSYPNESGCANYINAVLLSMAAISTVTVNALNKCGLGALHLAVQKNNHLMVKKMLSCLVKIDVNLKCSRDGNTALHIAAMFGFVSIIDELLNSKADVNLKNKSRVTPLDIAIQFGRFNVVKSLAAVDDVEDREGHLLDAARLGDLDIIKILLNNGSVNVDYKSEYGSLLLLKAAMSGDFRTIEFLLTKGVNVNARTTYLLTPLHLVIKKKNLQLVELLVTHGADVNASSVFKLAPIHDATAENCLEIVKFLIEKGADINKKCKDSNTPLHYAVKLNYLQIVELLLKEGADVNAISLFKKAPLHFAVEKKYFKIVEILVTAGADVNAKDLDLKTPLCYAVEGESSDIAKFLLKNGADLNVRALSKTNLHDVIEMQGSF